MASHGVNAEGKRLPRMAATLMMRFAPERESTFGVHRASVKPLAPNSEFKDTPSPAKESQPSNPELRHFIDIEEPTAVDHLTLEVPLLESSPQVEELDSGPESPSAWSLGSIIEGETTLEDLEDTADDTLRRGQRTGGMLTFAFKEF